MRHLRDRVVIAERSVPAGAQRIFDILADPAAHRIIDGSGAVGHPLINAPERLCLGSRFTVRMRMRPPDLTAASLVQVAVALANRGKVGNTVVEFDEPNRIAWRNFGCHLWRYELTPISATETLVRETFDYADNLSPRLLELAGFPDSNRQAMCRTLDRLAEMVAADR